ncbi:MAG TPA: response regulator [Xanthomonadales bacterium]|nr:response regulator [Xanthomonadales bacterium]
MNPPLGRRPRVILVDDDPGLLRLLTLRLKSEGYDVAASENATQAQTAIPRFQPDVVVTDLRMADVDGIGLLRELQRRYPALPVILMTAHGTIPDAVEATKSGAFAFLTKPVDKDQLLEQLQKALKVSGFAQAHEDWRDGIITRSPIMEDRLSKALQAASTDAPVLLSGQPGTGKEPLARAIHKASARRDQPFMSLACTSVAGEDLAALLTESTGTLYLDEIADLDLQAQSSLAKLLESRSSGAGPRLVAASARDLSGAIAKGFFRENLYYRLGVVQIDLPPLAQRREDIPLLAAHFLAELARTDERHVFAPEAVELLMSAEWPGNGPQLFNLVRQAAALAAGPVISAEIVQQALGGSGAARVPTFDEAREEFTRIYLSQLLQITRGNVTQAARLARRNRTDFYKLLAKHDLSPESFKL